MQDGGIVEGFHCSVIYSFLGFDPFELAVTMYVMFLDVVTNLGNQPLT